MASKKRNQPRNHASRADGPRDILKPVYGKKDPLRTKLKAIKKDITEAQFDNLTSAVKTAWQNDTTSAKELGVALLALKAAFYQHSQFTKWLRANGVDQNRASYCMRVAEGKVKVAQQKHAALPQTKAKKKIDDLFKLTQAPFEPEALVRTMYEMNLHAIAGFVNVVATQHGWQVGRDFISHTDPKWIAVTKELTNTLLRMWETVLLIPEELPVSPLPALPPARERGIGKTLKSAKPKARAAAASAGSGFAP
jgi:hypothetical protein